MYVRYARDFFNMPNLDEMYIVEYSQTAIGEKWFYLSDEEFATAMQTQEAKRNAMLEANHTAFLATQPEEQPTLTGIVRPDEQ